MPNKPPVVHLTTGRGYILCGAGRRDIRAGRHPGEMRTTIRKTDVTCEVCKRSMGRISLPVLRSESQKSG